MNKLKQQLYILCQQHIAKREADLKQILADLTEAANDDTKSSAGDKFETGREMMDQDIEMNGARLAELQKQSTVLSHITPGQPCTLPVPGALVYTTAGNYYISISAGQLKLDGTTYYAVSAASPIGTKLSGLKKDDSFELNGKTITIKDIA